MKRASIIALVLAAVAAIAIFTVPKVTRPLHAQAYAECINGTSATPACQSSQYGIVTIAAGSSTVVVNTTAVTTNAVFDLAYDASTNTGTLLSVTCNTTAQQPYISARTPGSSFTIKVGSNFSSNPGCIMFRIVNQ